MKKRNEIAKATEEHMPKRIEDEARIDASTRKLDDYPAYASAKTGLANLKAKLIEAQRVRDLLVLRASSTVKKMHDQSAAVMPQMADQVFDDMASKVAAAGDVPESLLGRLQYTALQLRAEDESDTEDLSRIRQEERRVMLLKRAVALTERTVLKEKNAAIAALIGPVRIDRAALARQTAEAFLNFAATLAAEDSFIEALRSREEALLGPLRPGPFPLTFSDPAVSRWIASALGLTEEDAQKRIASRQQAEAATR